MTARRDCHEPATEEQLSLLRQLGTAKRINIEIPRVMAEISIKFLQATPRQLAYLSRLGYEISGPITKQKASELIENRLRERE